jgi:hypothetical protein
MLKELIINRKIIYLTIDNFRSIDDDNNLVEQNSFVAYYSLRVPTEIILGERILNSNSKDQLFNSIEEAITYSNQFLKNIIYPPSFLEPIRYTKDNLAEILHKRLKFEIGEINSDLVQKIILGTIHSCTLATNEPHLPAIANILDDYGKLHQLNFFQIKTIKLP